MQEQAEVNIGMIGHVDHGKTTIVKALTGKWTDTHSEELKRGITIRLGYADALVFKCGDVYTARPECEKHGKHEAVRRVAFVDAPGHETLMAVLIAGSSIMDGVLFTIAANEECPQPQTYEHLKTLEIMGIKNIVVVQNKVDLVTPEDAKKNHDQIRAFLKGSIAEKAPIIPVAAHHGLNLDALVTALQENIPTPKRDPSLPARMFVARSFDVNKPGAEINKLVGGVLGGSLLQGRLAVGDEVEIRPGIAKGEKWAPIVTRVTSLNTVEKPVGEAFPGGLIGVGTSLDPALTKADQLVGASAGKPGTLPPVLDSMMLDVRLIERHGEEKIDPLRQDEVLVVNVGTATTIGFVTKLKPATLRLKRPVCGDKGWKAALSRRVGNRWRLIGYGIIA
jgi:translation initiation factor 2 subunit 3